MRILLVSDDRIRLDGGAGPLTIEADSPEASYSPFHMLASGLATCVFSVLHSWATNAGIAAGDLAVEVGWEFVENPHRVGRYDVALHWPSLPPERRASAERAAHLCTVHRTLQSTPEIHTHIAAP